MTMDSSALIDTIKTKLQSYMYNTVLPDNTVVSTKLFDFTKTLPGMTVNPQEALIKTVVEEVIKHIKDFAVVTVKLDVGFLQTWAAGVPTPQDGGAALKSTVMAFLATQPTAEKATGDPTIPIPTGGIK